MNVLISGYYGFGNAGDELILDSIITSVRSSNPGAGITVLSATPKKTAAHYSVRSVNRWSAFHVLRALWRTDLLISGGGGLFQDTTGNISLYYYSAVIFLAKMMKKKVFVYAVGINNLKKINRRATVKVLAMADKITLREKYSFDLLRGWGGRSDTVEITADPVLARKVTVNRIENRKPKVALILRPPHRGPWPVETFAKLADSLSHRLSANILFIPFHTSVDIKFTLGVMNSMQSTARLVQWSSTNDLFDVFKSIDMVIGQRLHALILAALHEIPLIGISEDPKIERFLQELGQKNISVEAGSNPYSLLAVIADVWEWRGEFRKNLGKIVPSLRARALKNTEFLAEYLNER